MEKTGKAGEEGLTLNLQTSGELLPRIAEEKDSPTSGGGGGGISTEILKELKGVKEEPLSGDVKDKIKRFSFCGPVDVKIASTGGKCDKVDVESRRGEKGEVEQVKKKDEAVSSAQKGSQATTGSESAAGEVKGRAAEREKSAAGSSNINHPTGHNVSSKKRST